MFGRRRALSRAESLERFERRQQLKRDAMTPADIDALMRKTIDECLDRIGVVSRDDLLQANIPPEAIDMFFRKTLLEVVADRKRRGIRNPIGV